MDIQNYIATGGISGTVVAVFYLLYKCCYKKRIRSSCMGGTLDIKEGQTSPDSTKKEVQVQV